MGLFDNILSKIAPADEADYDDGQYTPDQPAYIPIDPRTLDKDGNNMVRENRGVKPSIDGGTNVMGTSIEMKVVKPDRFEMVADIADLLLKGNTVLLNLEDTNKETTRRLIDFMTGVAYAISGDLRRIANNTYVVTPNNVKVSDNEENEGAGSTEAF